MKLQSTLLKTFILAAVLSVLGLPAFAQQPRLASIAAQAGQVSEFDVNGLKVIVKRRASAPTVAGGLFIRGGVRNMTEKNAGIENLMLSTAIEAGKNMPRQTVRRELSRLGSGISASGGPDYSAASFATTREGFDRVWEIFSEVLMNPAFSEEDLKRNRELVLTRLRESEVNPEGALENMQARVIYSGHPYSVDPIGTVETISPLTANDLRAYHKNMMQTSRLLLVLVGDLDPEEVKAEVARTFGRLPRGDYKETPMPPVDFSKGTVEVISRQLPTNYIQGAFAAPSLSNPDYYAMRVATAILQSLVYQTVRVQRQLSYAPDASLNNFAANTGEIAVSTTDPNEAIGLMLNQIKLIQSRTFNDDLIGDVAGSFLTNYYMGQETNAAQAGELARYELIGGGWRNAFEFLNRVRNVKGADVRRVANTYMKNIKFVVIGNPQSIDRSVFALN